jgi:mRNA interferase MazF
MISSQLHHTVPNVDDIIETTDTDFAQTGLKTASVIRLTRLAVVEETIFAGTIGEISSNRLAKLKKQLSEWIEKS